MERIPGFIGTAGMPLVRQANISHMPELIPANMSRLSKRILTWIMSRDNNKRQVI